MVDSIRRPPPPPPPPPKPKEIHKQLQDLQAQQLKGPKSADHAPPVENAQDKAEGRITKDTLETTGDPTMKSIADHMDRYDTNQNGLDANEFEHAFNDAAPMQRDDAATTPDTRVMQMQQDLNKANNAKEGDANYIKEDGFFGPQTEGAVKDFQTKNGIQPTGQADGDTMATLNPPAPVDNAERKAPAGGAQQPGDKPDAAKPPEAKGDPDLQPKPEDKRTKATREDVAEDLAKAKELKPGGEDFDNKMKDAIKGLQEDSDKIRNDDNRNDMAAIRDQYAAAAAEPGLAPDKKADYETRAKIFNDMSKASHFDGGAAHDIVQALQDGDNTNQDLNDAMGHLKDDKEASPEMMRAMGEAIKLRGSKDYDNGGYDLDTHGAKDKDALGDALIAAGGPNVATEVRNNIRLGLTDNDDTSNDYNRAVDAASKGECGKLSVDDVNALKAFAGAKPDTFKHGEVGRLDALAKHFDQLPDAAKPYMVSAMKEDAKQAGLSFHNALNTCKTDKERQAVLDAINDQPADRRAEFVPPQAAAAQPGPTAPEPRRTHGPQ